MALLEDQEIDERLGDAEGWEREGDAIVKTFDRDDFTGAVSFTSSMVEPANAMNHHPDVAISWSEVKVSITNHAEGGLTAADFELAAKIDDLAG